MKPLKLSEDDKLNILKEIVAKFAKEFDEFSGNMNETKFNFTKEICSEVKEKIQIIYKPETFLKMQALVDYYKTEVSWYGLVKQLSDKKYYVYDVKVFKQTVNGGKVDTEDYDIEEFWDSLTDEEFNDLHFQAHSHVNMSTGASCVDLQNQTDIVKNMGDKGFYLFQIWNKKGDINTYLYDLDNNVFYDRKDVEIDFGDENGLVSDFVGSTIPLVKEKAYPYYSKSSVPVKGKGKKESSYLPGYWDGTYMTERWDW